MASYNYTFTSGDTLTPTKLNSARTISNIVNADIDSAAAIAGTKIAPDFGSQNMVTTGAVGLSQSSPSGGKICIGDGTSTASAPTWTGGIRLGVHGSQSLNSTGGLEFVASTFGSGFGWRLTGADVGGGSTPFVIESRAGSATWSERMRIDASGNVGIGKTSPSSRLHLAGETAQFPIALQIDATAHATSRRASVGIGDYQWLQDTSGNGTKDFALFDSNAGAGIRMAVSASGNVGIGTAGPSHLLDVAGDINTSEQYLVDGTQVVSNRATGWEAATGTATRTTFATNTVTTAQLAQRVKALIDDLTTHGLIGA